MKKKTALWYVLVLQLAQKVSFNQLFCRSMLRRSLVAINTIPAMNVLNNEFSANYRFICSGVLTSLLLEGDVRTVTTNRNQYPEVQVWRIDAGITPTWVARQEIRLAAGDFSPDGAL